MFPPISNTQRLLTAVVASSLVGACGGDGDGGTGPPPTPTPTIDITLSPTTLSVSQGATGTVNVVLVRGGGFSGAVAITIAGAPAGVTATAAPASIPAGITSSTITVGAAASTTPGGYTLTVRATGPGVAEKTAQIGLTVTAAQGFTMAVAPTTLSVQQGTSGTATVTLTRAGGFAGGVGLTATGLPAGVTAVFDPQSVTATSSTLTLTAATTAAVGPSTVTIRGAAPPLAEQTATLTLNVSAAPAANTAWDFCSPADMPLWFAFQDGSGSWTRVTPTGTRFQFNIASTNGGVAFVSAATEEVTASAAPASALRAAAGMARSTRRKWADARSNRFRSPAAATLDGFDLTVFYGTRAELNAEGTECPPGGAKTVNGTVANVPILQFATVSLGGVTAEVSGGQSAFQLLGVQDGALDLIAARGTPGPFGLSQVIDRLIIRRGLDQPNNSTLPVLDFGSAETFVPAQADITVANVGSDLSIVANSYFTANGTAAVLSTGVGITPGPLPYYGVPAGRQIAGDLHFAMVLASPFDDEEVENARLAGLFFREATDRTVTLGASLSPPTNTVVATAPYVRVRAQGSVPAAYNKIVQVGWDQTTSTVLRLVSVGASSAYLANATTYDFTIPDFSATAGWDNNWGLRPGVETEWEITALGFTGIGLTFPAPVDGATLQGAFRLGTFTP